MCVKYLTCILLFLLCQAVVFHDTVHDILEKLPLERTDDDVEELMNYMQNISACSAFFALLLLVTFLFLLSVS